MAPRVEGRRGHSTGAAWPLAHLSPLHRRRAPSAAPLLVARSADVTSWTAVWTLGLVLVIAPLLPGLATKTKSWLTGRRGAPVLQLYFDLGKLWRKRSTYSRTTTWVFRLAPVAVGAAAVGAACLG